MSDTEKATQSIQDSGQEEETALTGPSGKGAALSSKKASKHDGIHKARNACILIVFIAIVVALFFNVGLGTLSSLGVGAIAYICPLGALETMLAGHALIPRLIIGFICVVVVVALVGRLFCSWVCVVPPLIRFFHPGKKGKKAGSAVNAAEGAGDGKDEALSTGGDGEASAPIAANHVCPGCAACSGGSPAALPPVGGKRDGIQIDTRHGVLAGALVSSLAFGFPVFCLICPVGLTLALVVGIYSAIFEHNPTVSLLIFAAILLIEVVFFRKWCHKLCPIGALMSLIGVKAPLVKPRVNPKKCLREKGVDCRVCVEVCPEELDPHCKSIPECTKCGKCIEKCPASAISFKPSRNSKEPHEADLDRPVTVMQNEEVALQATTEG